jgi:hypothetical protein
MKIKTGKDHHQSKILRTILFGKTSTRKTGFAIQGLKKGVLIDYERGLGDLDVPSDMTILECNTASDYREALDYISENVNKYETIVIDSKTFYGDQLYAALTEVFVDAKDSLRLWNELDKISRQRLEQLMSIPLNVVMIFLEDEVVLESGFRGTYMMYKAKKYKASLEAKFDIIIHTSKDEEGNIIMDAAGSNVCVGKNRFVKTLGNDFTKYNNMQEVIDKLNTKE